MKFLAVGTNMDEAHLRRWVPTARFLTVASLAGYVLSWDKRSSEGGKLTPCSTGRSEDVIYGVLYELDDRGGTEIGEAQRAAGYRAERVVVTGTDGVEQECTVYVAPPEMLDGSLRPRKAYRDPIVAAARAVGLPAHYVDALAQTPVLDE